MHFGLVKVRYGQISNENLILRCMAFWKDMVNFDLSLEQSSACYTAAGKYPKINTIITGMSPLDKMCSF